LLPSAGMTSQETAVFFGLHRRSQIPKDFAPPRKAVGNLFLNGGYALEM
jgi:hypothetical protein